jgi:hypothetical protein
MTSDNDREQQLCSQKIDAAGAFIGDGTSDARFVAKSKPGLAVHHLFAATFFADHATKGEAATDHPTEEQRNAHRAYVLGAVFTATAFMEAGINELYLSAAEGSPYSEFGLDDMRAAELAKKWREGEGRDRYSPVLTKFQDALTLSQLPAYDEATSPYRDASRLIDLRNAITHYKPEWDVALDKHAHLANKLQGYFPESRFADPNQVFFPHRCLGAGCAQWAVAASSNFVIDFRKRMGLNETFRIDEARISSGVAAG